MSRPLPELVLFIDECLGTCEVPNALRRAGLRVELLSDHFPLSTSDVEWLSEIGKRGWVVLTKDRRIRRRDLEFRAVCDAGVAMFVLTGANMTGEAMAVAFTRAYPRIQKLLRDYARPFLASISATGDVRLLTPATRYAGRRKS